MIPGHRESQSHEVVPAGLGTNEKGGKARVYTGTTDAVQILWKGDSLQYVSSRGQRLHLELAQLWRCPVSWCTVWRGSPQDCMEHLRNGHDVPWISKTASIERFAPPWTVRREVWTESMRLEHSGISTDILLFSELGLSLTHHYRVYRGGLPHAAFRSDYMTRLRALLPTPQNTTGEPTSPPESGRGATPRSARRSHQLSRPVRVMSEAVGELPLLTVQNPADMIGETVLDCRPPGLPVSIPLSVLSPRTLENARGTSGFNPSREEGRSIMDMDTSEITISRIVGFPWNDPGTDVEDELPTPASSPAQCTTPAVMPVEPGDPQEREDNFDLDLAKVLLDVSVMPTMISPIEDSLASPTTAVSEYAVPDIPTVELVTESPGYAVPEDSELVTSWVPRYSPASMASTVGMGDTRPTSTGQPSPYGLPVMGAPCTETLDRFLPNMPSPVGDSSRYPGHEEMSGEAETEAFVVEAPTESLPAIGRQAEEVGGPDVSREVLYDV